MRLSVAVNSLRRAPGFGLRPSQPQNEYVRVMKRLAPGEDIWEFSMRVPIIRIIVY